MKKRLQSYEIPRRKFNIDLKMKLTLLFFLTITFAIHADPTYSQRTRISIHMKDVTIFEVFDKIESSTEFKFIFKTKDVDLKRKVSLNVEKEDILKILESLFPEEYVSVEILDRKILLKRKEYTPSPLSVLEPTKKEVQFTVTGIVKDDNGLPLPGANILEKGTSNGVTTDLDGNFSINVPKENATLMISYIGFETKEIILEGQANLTVTLNTSAGLDEVVVIGYGSQKVENVIGSVSTVSSEQITQAPVSNISNALAGRLPGAIIQQRNGEPGNNAADITIRGNATLGNSSPLIVVDGIPGRDLNSINPNDVESITVLKDAAAAIYGARAANGVVLVTTKKGTEGTPATFNYSFNQGFLTPTVLPEMADAPTYAQMIRENQSYRSVDESNMRFSLEDIERFRSGEFPWTHPNTNWFDAALADYSTTQSHNLSATGGGESVTYYASFGKEFADGIYKNSATSYNRYNLNANLGIEANEYLSFNINILASQENRKYSTRPTGDIFSSILRAYPTSVAVYPNGLPGPDIEYGDNPVITPSFETGFDDDKRYRMNNKFSVNLIVPGVEGLSLSSYYGYDMFFQQRKLFQKPWTLYALDENAYFAAGNTGKEDGSDFLVGSSKGFAEPRLTDSYGTTRTTNFNFTVNYEKTFGDFHNFSAFVAYENSEFKAQGIEAFRRFFISDKLPYLFAGGDDQKDNSGWVEIDARENYFGRLSYNFRETYLFSFTFRRDGSLRFSEEQGRWGNFPAILLGWRTSNEKFWQDNLSFINFFKLKASWGQLGNDLVEPFQYVTGYSFGSGGVFGSNRGYSNSIYQSSTPNPFITWEVANMYNAGFESMFFNNKVNFDVNVFYQRRSDILVQRNASVPAFTGISLPDENFGIVDSKGFEVVLGYNDEFSDFSYGINGNLAFARNEIIEFDEPARNVPWQVRTGHPQGAELLYKSAGIFRDTDQVNSMPHVPGAQPGDIIILDYDGDGEITNDDRVLFDETANPEITFGVSFELKYKNWGLSALVQGVGSAMRRMYNDDRQGTGGNYFAYDAIGRWTPDNRDATKPRAFERLEEYWRGSHITDYSYTNTDYARMKNAQLSYTIPSDLRGKIGLKMAQIYVSGQNLFFIWNKSKIFDPELGTDTSYPLMRVVSLGARISL